jgi:hypothetical protein
MNIGYNNTTGLSAYFPTWNPFVTSINMNGTNGATDCTAYIDKLVSMASNNPPGTLFISGTAAGYGNTNWYFDYGGSTGFSTTDPAYLYSSSYSINAVFGVTNVDPLASVILSTYPNASTLATNVAGYFTCGWDCGGDVNLFDDGSIKFFGQSGWYIMTTIDSFDGQRDTDPSQHDFVQANFLSWFTTNSFGGTNYSNTPVGAVTTVEEPQVQGHVNPAVYFGDWEAGKSFAISAWAAQTIGNGLPGIYFQAVGDPFVKK